MGIVYVNEINTTTDVITKYSVLVYIRLVLVESVAPRDLSVQNTVRGLFVILCSGGTFQTNCAHCGAGS